jgi:hypothetical protein
VKYPLSKKERAIGIVAALCLLVGIITGTRDAFGYVALALMVISVALYINRTGSAF